MLLFTNSLLSLTTFLFATFLATPARATPVYNGHYCNNTVTYQPNSTFQRNINVLLSSLSSNASQDSSGSYDTAMGAGTPFAVNGYYLCRGDIAIATCQDCVAAAANDIISRCPNQTEAVLWYDICTLRFTNSYFKSGSVVPGTNLTDGKSVSNTDISQFNQSLFRLLNDLGTQAANSETAKKFGTREVRVTRSMTVYGLAQCSGELSSPQCETCLQNAVGVLPSCCGGRQGARVLLATCNVRYELSQFYNSTTSSPGKKKYGSGAIAMIVILPLVFIILSCLGCYFLLGRSRKSYKTTLSEHFGNETGALESLQFSLATLEVATDKFSHQNRIGQGGFGEVYKGVLRDGQEIAVKKLSKSSGQGSIEFKNEILLIAKLQHRNLVVLLGFCLEAEEKILVYEYVPNKSLDYFLFDSQRQPLSWVQRYRIMEGIARGILYLHEHSRLKVIHRDLKPSNVLLDDNMDPKISDFGMARIVAIDHGQVKTRRIVGTYGYMSPEYAMHGQFSEKSDVFSFGVITLEVISAKRNARSLDSRDVDDLISHAWRQWRDQTPLEILDPILKEVCPHNEVMKCIQIGLLCVQENPNDRPTMANVVSYFSSPSADLPLPRQPAFFMNNGMAGESSSGSASLYSVNDLSITNSFPR